MATTDAKQAPHYAPTAGVLLLKIGKAAERRFEKALKPLGLTPRHLGVLFEVQACPTSQQALIEMVGVDPSKLVGLLNDDTTDVGSVHLGVVYVADAAGRPVTIRETDKLTGRFVEHAGVAEVAADLETWSQLVFEQLEGAVR